MVYGLKLEYERWNSHIYVFFLFNTLTFRLIKNKVKVAGKFSSRRESLLNSIVCYVNVNCYYLLCFIMFQSRHFDIIGTYVYLFSKHLPCVYCKFSIIYVNIITTIIRKIQLFADDSTNISFANLIFLFVNITC